MPIHMRTGRWFNFVVMLLSLLVSIATVTLWARGTEWIRHAEKFRRPHLFHAGDVRFTDQGIRSIGIYSHRGQVGIISVESGIQWLEDDEISLVDPPNPREIGWIWTHTGEMNDYMGGIPDQLYPEWVTFAVPHSLHAYAGEEQGMRHFLRIHAILVNARIVLAFSLAPWFVWAVAFVRRRRRKSVGFCLRCGYDLRATPLRCPECGNNRRSAQMNADKSLT